MSEYWTWLVNNSSAVMVILTSFTLIWSIRTQVRLDKQRNEDIRARIHGYLISDDLHTYLCLTNTGKRSAWNIQIHLNEELMDVLPTHFSVIKAFNSILNDLAVIWFLYNTL